MRKLNHLTFITLWANSADNKLVIFFSYFSQKTGFDIAYIETICMKCQMFSGKNKKNISKCCLLKILPRLLSIKYDLSGRKQLINLYNDKDTSLALVHTTFPQTSNIYCLTFSQYFSGTTLGSQMVYSHFIYSHFVYSSFIYYSDKFSHFVYSHIPILSTEEFSHLEITMVYKPVSHIS